MTACPSCSAATLAPLVPGGATVGKMQERLQRIARRIMAHDEMTYEDASALQCASDTIGWLAAERVRLMNEATP